MCTALTYTANDTYFARNLDLEYAYKEQVVVTPRRFVLPFRNTKEQRRHYAMIGTAYVPHDIPLYYDAVNEKGLGIAALNFPTLASYESPCNGAIAPFEVIPFVLSQCATVKEVCELMMHTPIGAISYSKELPHTPLHWFAADSTQSVAIEPTESGLHITSDPVGVLTNSPPLSFHLTHLASYTGLSPHTPPTSFGDIPLTLYSRGMGGMGLPGDYSSASRFVRAAFVKCHAVCDGSEAQAVSQTFHILDSVAHPRGCVVMPDGRCEITVYSSCCNLRTGVYYYKTYNGSGIHAVALQEENVHGDTLAVYPMIDAFEVTVQC